MRTIYMTVMPENIRPRNPLRRKIRLVEIMDCIPMPMEEGALKKLLLSADLSSKNPEDCQISDFKVYYHLTEEQRLDIEEIIKAQENDYDTILAMNSYLLFLEKTREAEESSNDTTNNS